MLGGGTVTRVLNEIENLLKRFFFSFRLSTIAWLLGEMSKQKWGSKKKYLF